jgi:3-(3-hydroxy-phenyl)propionate hydroxylase
MVRKNEDRVLIAGAGPSGMVAAYYLAQQGIPVTVFEAQAELPTDLRASTFHPATLDQLDAFPGVTKELIEWGLIAPTWQFRDRETGPVVTWDLSILKGDTGHPYRLQTEQWKLTRILARRLGEFPHAELRFRHEAVSAANEADAVALTVKTPDGIAIERGRYLIGADGANSAVRRSNDVPFEGVTFPELYFTLSTRFPFEAHLPNLTYVNYISDPGEWVVLLRVAENWRVLLPSRPGEPRDEILEEPSVQRRLNGIVQQEAPYETVHRTLYHVHERVAERYRIGRIFLAGDAAHINNPLGGMGMNGGIQDGFNIAQKLAKVWRREADDTLLDRYGRQRRWSALDFVQKNAVRNRENLRQTDPAVRAATHDAMRRTAADPKAAREFLLRTSMIQALRECEAIA